MAERLASGKKIFATSDFTESDVVFTTEEKTELSKKVENEITSESIKREKTIKEVTEYNTDALKITKQAQNIKLPGNKILVKLFKHNPYKGAFYSPIMIARDRNDSGRYQMEPAALQFSPRGVIVAMSDSCSDNFKKTYKVGDIVDLINGIGLEDHICMLDKTERPTVANIEYFMFTEGQVEKGFKDNLNSNVHFE